MAGSQEYMAMEKLYELSHEGRYDLLVLDTPPSRNALDFLDAPRRLSEFIDSRSLQLLTEPGRLGLKVLGRGTQRGVLGDAAGHRDRPAPDLGEFFRAFGDMTEGFRERAGRVNELLGAAHDVVRAGHLAASARRSTRASTSTAASRTRGCRSPA